MTATSNPSLIKVIDTTPRVADNGEDRLSIPLEPEEALRGLLQVDPQPDEKSGDSDR